jgi:hypothetical protein
MLLNHVVATANLSWRPVIAMLPSFSFVAKPRPTRYFRASLQFAA